MAGYHTSTLLLLAEMYLYQCPDFYQFCHYILAFILAFANHILEKL